MQQLGVELNNCNTSLCVNGARVCTTFGIHKYRPKHGYTQVIGLFTFKGICSDKPKVMTNNNVESSIEYYRMITFSFWYAVTAMNSVSLNT